MNYNFLLKKKNNKKINSISGSTRNLPVNGSPEPPLPPPRNNHDSLNDSKESNEISEAECDRDDPRGNYGGKIIYSQ